VGNPGLNMDEKIKEAYENALAAALKLADARSAQIYEMEVLIKLYQATVDNQEEQLRALKEMVGLLNENTSNTKDNN
jgi:hypothetical protein